MIRQQIVWLYIAGCAPIHASSVNLTDECREVGIDHAPYQPVIHIGVPVDQYFDFYLGPSPMRAQVGLEKLFGLAGL